MKVILKSLLITTVLTVPSVFGSGFAETTFSEDFSSTKSSISMADIILQADKNERDGDLNAAAQIYVGYATQQPNVLWFHVLFSVKNMERLGFFGDAIGLLEWSKIQSNTRYFAHKADSEIARLEQAYYAQIEHEAAAKRSAIASFIKVISESDDAKLVFEAARQLSRLKSLELDEEQMAQLSAKLSGLIFSHNGSLNGAELSQNIETVSHLLYSLFDLSIQAMEDMQAMQAIQEMQDFKEMQEFKTFVNEVDPNALWTAMKNVFEWQREEGVKLIQVILKVIEFTPADYRSALGIIWPEILDGYAWKDSGLFFDKCNSLPML